MPKRVRRRKSLRDFMMPVLSDIEEDSRSASRSPAPQTSPSQPPEEGDDEDEVEFPVFCVDASSYEQCGEIGGLGDNDVSSPDMDTRYCTSIDDQRQMSALDEDNEPDISELYLQYNHECQHLLSTPPSDKDQKYIAKLESTVRDLLEQNQGLVENLSTIASESEQRVGELQSRLHNSAQRTEETMLALHSHELYLKSFSEHHCCACCACDNRLLATRLCHGGLCEFDPNAYQHPEQHQQQHCSMGARGFARVMHNTEEWFENVRRPRAVDAHRLECIQNLPSQVRFSTLVDRLQRRVSDVEHENRELKHENALIRQLNAYLSGRDLAMTMPRLLDHNRNPTTVKFHDYDAGGSQASWSPPTSEGSCDSCGVSRPESLTEGRHDNDSGCSTTDLIPSTTDIASLLLSDVDCDDDCLLTLDDTTKAIHTATATTTVGAGGASTHTTTADSKRAALTHAERLVPKLFQQLLYYVAQRNILVKQFKIEADARQVCKADIASLADTLVHELGAMGAPDKIAPVHVKIPEID